MNSDLGIPRAVLEGYPFRRVDNHVLCYTFHCEFMMLWVECGVHSTVVPKGSIRRKIRWVGKGVQGRPRFVISSDGLNKHCFRTRFPAHLTRKCEVPPMLNPYVPQTVQHHCSSYAKKDVDYTSQRKTCAYFDCDHDVSECYRRVC